MFGRKSYRNSASGVTFLCVINKHTHHSFPSHKVFQLRLKHILREHTISCRPDDAIARHSLASDHFCQTKKATRTHLTLKHRRRVRVFDFIFRCWTAHCNYVECPAASGQPLMRAYIRIVTQTKAVMIRIFLALLEKHLKRIAILTRILVNSSRIWHD